jgi:putative endonuclease
MFCTYVLYSSTFNKIYIGQSSNLEQRISSHNSPENSHWTKSFQPWEVLFYEDFQTRSEAINREKQLKSSRGRDYIWKIVREKNLGC